MKSHHQANKKQRISSTQSESDSEQHAPQTVKKKPQRAAKTKAKTKISKSKVSSQQQRNSAESSLSPRKDRVKSIESNKKQIDNMIPTTKPLNRLQIEAIIESTTKKPAEPSKPVTRGNNGKVKQAIEIFEQQLRTATKTTEKIPRVVSNTSNQVRSSIDKRNLRSSQAKQQVKRKSVKNVNAFVKAAKSDLNATSTIKTLISDQTIQEEEVKSGGDDKRITRNILSSTLVQQQYRVPNIFKSALKANGERKPSLLSSNNFLDRNTPSKHTKTVHSK